MYQQSTLFWIAATWTKYNYLLILKKGTIQMIKQRYNIVKLGEIRWCCCHSKHMYPIVGIELDDKIMSDHTIICVHNTWAMTLMIHSFIYESHDKCYRRTPLIQIPLNLQNAITSHRGTFCNQVCSIKCTMKIISFVWLLQEKS